MGIQNGASERSLSAWDLALRASALAGTLILLVCVGLFVWKTRHWPLVNDPALMYYVAFLVQKGLAPYREIHDINLPGAYAPEWLAISLAKLLRLSDAAAWRCLDFSAVLLAGWAMARIAKPWGWFAGVWAAGLFTLYHGRDGVGHAGQRDLWIAVLLLWAIAALMAAMRDPQSEAQALPVVCFGLLLGAASTVKPLSAPYLFLLTPLLLQRRTAWVRPLLWAGAGFVLPLLTALGFVQHWAALPAFWRLLRVGLPYHASLGDGTLPQLLVRSSIASVTKLLLIVTAVLVCSGRGQAGTRSDKKGNWIGSTERLVLAGCVLVGLLAFLAQGKGYPYQRYPYLAFLFLWVGLEFQAATRGTRTLQRVLGTAGLAFGVLFCAPSYLRGAVKAQWSTSISQAMEDAILEGADGELANLDGRVQCLDVVAGCTDALLHLHLREATGTIYDEFLFPQTPSNWGVPYSGPLPGTPVALAVKQGQQTFQAELLSNPPRMLIVSAWLFPQGPGGYRELALWPWFQQYLAEHYTLQAEHSFARAENGPLGFRVYIRQ